MRRLAPAIALALLAVAPAGAHPGHGAEAVNIEGDELRYSPPSVTIGVGDTVVWFWQGAVSRNHSVTAHPGQAETFDSDPNAPPDNSTHPEGDSFAHTFTQQGRFTYYCRNHATMQGVVDVVAVPTTKPLRFSDLRIASRRDHLDVRFRLTARADLVARIAERRHGRWRTVDTLNRRASRGKNDIDVPTDGLDPGPYRLTLTAYDNSNRRTETKERFEIKRSRGGA